MNEKTYTKILLAVVVVATLAFFGLLGETGYRLMVEISRRRKYHTEIISSIASPDNRTKFRAQFFNQSMNYVELLTWVDEHMKWVPSNEPLELRHTDPLKILENGTGRGRCGEYSYVYAAALWVHGYEARLVSAFIYGDHTWVEVKINDSWVHVDPSPPQRFNTPKAYIQRFYLFVFAYEADGSSTYLLTKYNPNLFGILLFLIVIIFSWYIVQRGAVARTQSISERHENPLMF